MVNITQDHSRSPWLWGFKVPIVGLEILVFLGEIPWFFRPDEKSAWRWAATRPRLPNSWMVYFMQNPNLKWMKIWGYPHDLGNIGNHHIQNIRNIQNPPSTVPRQWAHVSGETAAGSATSARPRQGGNTWKSGRSMPPTGVFLLTQLISYGVVLNRGACPQFERFIMNHIPDQKMVYPPCWDKSNQIHIQSQANIRGRWRNAMAKGKMLVGWLRRPWGYAYPANRPDIHAGSPIQVAPRKTPKPHESMALSKNWIPQNHPKSHVSFQLGTWKFIENLGIPWKSQLRGNFEVSISGQSRSSSPGRAPEVLCPARHGNASEHRKYHLKPRLVLLRVRLR